MPTFKAAYLIHGDDHGRVAERRARLRALAEAESGTSGVEILAGDACAPGAVTAALMAMTFATGRRFVIADGVERWKNSEVGPVIAALQGIDAATTTVAFFGRDEGRTTVPKALADAVQAMGGVVATESAVKPWQLTDWVLARAEELGLELDRPAAKTLIAHVGDRQQRLVRELEKLALEHGAPTRLDAETVAGSCATSAERKVWTLGDAVVAGDLAAATRILLDLRQQGERIPALLYAVARRVREALGVATALADGQSPAQVRRSLRMPSKAAERFMADVSERDVESLRRALEALADLELETRGGGGGVLSEDTAAVRTVIAAAR